MNIEELLNTEFVKNLLKEQKPTFLPYFKTEGPTITLENQDVMVESLMVDYFKKQNEILQTFKDYVSKKTDMEVLWYFQNEVARNIGSRLKIMHFYQYDPNTDIVVQLKKIMSLPDFHSWAIKI